MPKAPTTPATPKKGKLDWKKYGGRSAEEGDRVTWRASDEGDAITGVLARVDEVTTRFGSKVVIELDSCSAVRAGGENVDDGDYSLWPTPGLINAFMDGEADQGDTVTIVLTELIDTGKGNPFKRFEVTVADADAPF